MILSSKNICILHFTLLNAIVYKLLTNPAEVSGHAFVFIIGRAMRLPDAEFKEDDPAVGLIAILLLYLGVSDLATIVTTNSRFLEVAVPFRLMLAFTVSGFAYLTTGSNIAISNSMVFALSFVEVVLQFWLYITLLEETSTAAQVQGPPEQTLI
ncbi:increased loss of mitochondrial DNA protein 1 [Lipomyces kononenkoae]|uniref:Increased loss of mitochondrial DNA protein 1 n=1 Tax=Lipomyces kononenkoae TaxID=34357 RepID=A0ACC3T3P1_LIPKO